MNKPEAYLVNDRILRVTKNGLIRSESRKVYLTMEDGHFYPRKIGWGDTATTTKVITATGFAHLSSMSGLTFISPGTIIDDHGKEVGNPIIRRENGFVSYVRVRRIGIGRAANGDLRAIDRTLTYDVLAYYYNDLYMAWSDDKLDYKTKKPKDNSWGEVMNIDFARELVKQPANKHRAVAFAAPGVALVYDTNHQSVKTRIRENHQRALFGDRLAVTVCDRNIAKAHFGFANVGADDSVSITCWPMAEMDWERIRNTISARSGKIDLLGEEVKVEVAEEEIGAEDIEASEGAVDTDDGVNRPAGFQQEEAASQEWHPTMEDIRNAYWRYTTKRVEELGKEEATKWGHAKFLELAKPVFDRHKVTMSTLAQVTDQKIIDEIFAAVDIKNLRETTNA